MVALGLTNDQGEYNMSEPVILSRKSLEIWVRDITGYNYAYGATVPIFKQAEITDRLTAETKSQAYILADMLNGAAQAALKVNPKPVEGVDSAEPLDGCELTCFYSPGRGAESARVVLIHAKSPRPVIGYGRTVNGAIETANREMARLLKL